MITAISKDNWVLSLKGSVNIWIDESQKENILRILESNQKFFEAPDGRIVMKESVLYIVHAKDVEEANYIRRGWSKWDCGHWRPRNEKKCGDCYYI